MNIVVVGLSHKTASVEVREKLSIPEAQIEEAIALLKTYPHIEEIAIISTCNRLEIYGVATSIEQGVREIGQFLALGLVLLILGVWRQYNSYLKFSNVTNIVLMAAGFLLLSFQLTGYFIDNN